MSDYSFHLGRPMRTLGTRVVATGNTELIAAPGASNVLNITKVHCEVKTLTAGERVQVGEGSMTASDNVSLDTKSTGFYSPWFDWNPHAAVNTALNLKISGGAAPDVWVKVEYTIQKKA